MTLQEEAAQKAKEEKRKAEAAIAKKVAEEMGMGSVGKAQGVMLTAQRVKRKVLGEKVRHNISNNLLRCVCISLAACLRGWRSWVVAGMLPVAEYVMPMNKKFVC